MTLQKILKESRQKAKRTLQDVADYIGISAPYLHDLENGKALRPKIWILQKAAEYYSINADLIIINAEKIPPDVYWKIVNHPELLEVIRQTEV